MFRIVPLLAFLSLPAWPANVPVQEASAPAIIGTVMPGFCNGYLFSADPSHVLTLFAPDGHELLSLPIQRPWQRRWTLAASWVDRHDTGIDIRDLSGKLVRSIDTGLFAAAHLVRPGPFIAGLGLAIRRSQVERGETGLPGIEEVLNRRKRYVRLSSRSLFATGLPPGDEEYQAGRAWHLPATIRRTCIATIASCD
jgi:hypothetical protein